jgi:hypothetical protein
LSALGASAGGRGAAWMKLSLYPTPPQHIHTHTPHHKYTQTHTYTHTHMHTHAHYTPQTHTHKYTHSMCTRFHFPTEDPYNFCHTAEISFSFIQRQNSVTTLGTLDSSSKLQNLLSQLCSPLWVKATVHYLCAVCHSSVL